MAGAVEQDVRYAELYQKYYGTEAPSLQPGN
jgi:hypothetical protein